MTMSDRVPPHNAEAEALVLGTSLLDKGRMLVAIEMLSPDDFYRDAHKIIFTSMLAISRRGDNVDLVSVVEHLRNTGDIDGAGGAAYIASLTDCIPLPIGHHCKIIADAAAKRRIISACSDIIAKAYSGHDVESLQNDLGNATMMVAKQHDGPVTVDELMPSVLDEIGERCKSRSKLPGMSTGLADLDARLNGLQRSNYVVIAGRPGMGKTSLVMKIAETVSMDDGVLIFSMEMRNTRLVERLLCMGSRVPSAKVRAGRLTEDDWGSITSAAGKIPGQNIIIDHSAGLTIAELTARAKRVAMSRDISMVVVDYIQLMRGGSRHGNRALEVSEISAGLLALAKELNVCVVVLSQLNRMAEGRTDKRPMVSDLKESGAIEQDADVVLLLYRDEVYNDSHDNPDRGTAEIIIGKGRDIGTWTVRVGFCGERTEFHDLYAQ